MTRRILTSAIMIVAGVCMGVTAQPFLTGSLPKLEITTSGNIAGATNRGCTGLSACGSSGGMPGMVMGGVYPYTKITNFNLTVPGNPSMNVTRGGGDEDSIRGRGNSTGNQEPRPYRIKLGSKVGLFGRVPNRSWVLLSNYYDDSKALNAVGFELGRRIGLHGTPTVQYVELYLNGNRQGVYLLTDQIQVNEGRVDIDEDFGWLAELDYHGPDHSECNSYFKTSNPCMGVFIKSPEDRTQNEYQFVKDDINALANAVSSNNTSVWRELLDLESAAKYLLVQGFMANDDFYSSGGGGPGSNFIYKDVCHSRIYAGPLWDMDLSIGYFTGQCSGGGWGTMGCAKWNNTSLSMEPGLPFWRTVWNDPAFRGVLKRVWNEHKSQFQSINTFANQISNHTGISTNISSLNTWLSGRYTYVNGLIEAMTGDNSYTQSPEVCGSIPTGPFTITISISPAAGGTVTVKVGDAPAQPYTGPVSVATNNTQVVVTAVANDGYTFSEWSGALTANMESQKTQQSMSWGISSNRSLTANFRDNSQPPPPPVCGNNQFALTVNVNGDGTVTRNPQQDCYNLNAQVTLTANVGSGSRFVNWTGDIGSNNQGNAANRNITVSMSRERAITANFDASSSVCYINARAALPARAVLRANARGVMATLPVDHGYTSYKLIDLQGREIESGNIGPGTAELRFGGLRAGVVFLKLEGRSGVTTLRAASVR